MISTSEAELINKSRADDLGHTDQNSRSKLKDMFSEMSMTQHRLTIEDPDHAGGFSLTSRTDSDFEVLYSHDFTVNLKMGMFMEIFYSPFDDEVLELFIEERYDLMTPGHKIQADNEDEYDNTDKDNLKMFVLNKYKASKTLWLDLEPGEYTI